MTIARVLRTVCFVCVILSPFLPLELHAQTEVQRSLADSIHCSIEVEAEKWSRDKPIVVVVRLKNISDRDLDLLGIYSFELRGNPTTPYWSPVDVLSGKPLQLVYEDSSGGGRVPKAVIHLGAGDARSMNFDLSNLLWNSSFSSRWPHQGLFEVVPKGGYDLIFNVETDHRVNSDDVTHIPSQSVRIAIE
jgi:hypothetical protein